VIHLRRIGYRAGGDGADIDFREDVPDGTVLEAMRLTSAKRFVRVGERRLRRFGNVEAGEITAAVPISTYAQQAGGRNADQFVLPHV